MTRKSVANLWCCTVPPHWEFLWQTVQTWKIKEIMPLYFFLETGKVENIDRFCLMSQSLFWAPQIKWFLTQPKNRRCPQGSSIKEPQGVRASSCCRVTSWITPLCRVLKYNTHWKTLTINVQNVILPVGGGGVTGEPRALLHPSTSLFLWCCETVPTKVHSRKTRLKPAHSGNQWHCSIYRYLAAHLSVLACNCGCGQIRPVPPLLWV